MFIRLIVEVSPVCGIKKTLVGMCLVQALAIRIGKAFGYGSVELEIDIFALEATIRLLGIAVNVVALIIHTHLTFEVNQFVILSHSRMAKTCGKQQDNCFFHSKCRGYTPEIIEHFKVKAKGVQHPIV